MSHRRDKVRCNGERSVHLSQRAKSVVFNRLVAPVPSVSRKAANVLSVHATHALAMEKLPTVLIEAARIL